MPHPNARCSRCMKRPCECHVVQGKPFYPNVGVPAQANARQEASYVVTVSGLKKTSRGKEQVFLFRTEKATIEGVSCIVRAFLAPQFDVQVVSRLVTDRPINWEVM